MKNKSSISFKKYKGIIKDNKTSCEVQNSIWQKNTNKKEKPCRIYYSHWGRQFSDRYWCIVLPNGEALDYGRLEHCKRVYIKEGLKNKK